jgi:hypothetical protein
MLLQRNKSKMPGQLFPTNDEKFSFEAYGVTIMCQRIEIGRSVTYHVSFSSQRKPIMITKAKFVDSSDTWTSVPEGRQKEAQGIGELIDQYLSKKE